MAYRIDDPYNTGIMSSPLDFVPTNNKTVPVDLKNFEVPSRDDLGIPSKEQLKEFLPQSVVPVNNMQMAEISKKQLDFLNQSITQQNLKDQSFGLSTQQVFDKLPSYEDKPWFSSNQKPTTAAEFNEYLKSIGITDESQMVKDEESDDQTMLPGTYNKYGYQYTALDPFSAVKGVMALGTKILPKELLWLWKKDAQANTINKGINLLKKKKKISTTTGGGQKIIKKKKKISAPPGEKGGPGYIPPKYKPPQQTGGGGGVHSGMKTTSSRRHKAPGGSGYGPHKKADGGLINFFKNGGFLG